MPQVRLPHTPNPPIGQSYGYSARRGRPMLFQVTDPTGVSIWPFLLAMHVNPQQFNERMQKSKNVVMTWGGFVEFHWPDELSSLSATATTGAFLGPNTGLTSGSDGKGDNLQGRDTRVGASGRHGTMAWERQEDLLDLFRHNGIVYNGVGEPILRGQVVCIYDRGIFTGLFTTFSVKETDEKAFSFELDWEFKVESTIYIFPGSQMDAIQQPKTYKGRLDEQRQLDIEDAAALGSVMGNVLGGQVDPSPFVTEPAEPTLPSGIEGLVVPPALGPEGPPDGQQIPDEED